MIRCYTSDNHKLWYKNLSKLASAIRTQVNERIGCSYSFIVFRNEFPKNALPEVEGSRDGIEIDYQASARDRSEMFLKLYNDVETRLKNAGERNRKYYNLRHRDVRYNVGDKVYHKNFVQSNAANFFLAKLINKYAGPYINAKKYRHVLTN